MTNIFPKEKTGAPARLQKYLLRSLSLLKASHLTPVDTSAVGFQYN